MEQAMKEGATDYIKFMHWFQKSHPELYTYCCYSITAPIDGEGIAIDKDGLDYTTYQSVMQATQDYYGNENNQM